MRLLFCVRLTHNNVSLTVKRHFLSVYYLNNNITISIGEGPSLRTETFAIIDLREVSTKLNEYYSKVLSVRLSNSFYNNELQRCNSCSEQSASLFQS